MNPSSAAGLELIGNREPADPLAVAAKIRCTALAQSAVLGSPTPPSGKPKSDGIRYT